MKPLSIPGAILFLLVLTFFPPAHAQPQIGEKAPGFNTNTLDGKRITLKDYWEQQRKKVLVLSFFATWCQPCKEDLKYLQVIQDQNATHGLQVIAVLTQDSAKESTVREFMGKLGVHLPVLTDEFGIIGKRYSVIALPCNFVVDKAGILKAKYFGYSEEVKRHFERQLKDLLSSP